MTANQYTVFIFSTSPKYSFEFILKNAIVRLLGNLGLKCRVFSDYQ